MVDVGLIIAPNSTLLEKSLCQAIIEHDIPVEISKQQNVDLADEKWLKYLAWEFSVDDWNSAWDIRIKRQQIRESMVVHRHKGTVGAIKRIIGAFGGNAVLREWWQMVPKGPRGTFKITLSFADIGEIKPGAEYLNNILRMIDASKRESQHYTFTVANNVNSNIAVIAVVRVLNWVWLD